MCCTTVVDVLYHSGRSHFSGCEDKTVEPHDQLSGNDGVSILFVDDTLGLFGITKFYGSCLFNRAR